MLSVKVDFKVRGGKFLKVAEDATSKSLARAGALVRAIAQNSIRKAPPGVDPNTKKRKASKPGKPPLSHGPLYVLKRKAIRFDVQRQQKSVFVGPTASATEGFAKYHEFGGVRKGTTFPKRPFMGPALEKAQPRLPQQFKNIL